MRYWGKNIEIDATYYQTEMAKKMLPGPAAIAQAKAAGTFYQYEGDVDAFETTVQTMLRDIEGNRVGSILIDAINRSPRVLRIIPITWAEQSVMGKPPCANAVPGGNFTKGYDSVIWFEPFSRMMNLLTGGTSPHQVLVHELQHSLRQMRGKLNPSGPVGGFPNPEELYSVMLENMYLSAAGQPQRMLGAYRQDVSLNKRTAASFYKQYGNEIEAWANDLRDVSRQLETTIVEWNPLLIRTIALDNPFALDQMQ